jgi:hypothetical protein
MNDKQYFLSTLNDLRAQLNKKDEYSIIKISDLLFKLLMDSPSVSDRVNIDRIKIKFYVNNRKVRHEKNLKYWSIEDGIDPNTALPHMINKVKMNKSRLLSQVVMLVNGQPITVKNLIKFMRNKAGGVHRSNAKKDVDIILNQLYKELFIGGLPAGLRLLKAISRVVITGLTELESKNYLGQ